MLRGKLFPATNNQKALGLGCPQIDAASRHIVYHVKADGPLVPNREVEQAFWFPLIALCDAERRVEQPFVYRGRHLPGILVGEPGRHVVWGLTYRFVETFFAVVGCPLPNRWDGSEN